MAEQLQGESLEASLTVRDLAHSVTFTQDDGAKGMSAFTISSTQPA